MIERLLNMEHGNIISMLGCYEDDQNFYSILETCDGGDLSRSALRSCGLQRPRSGTCGFNTP